MAAEQARLCGWRKVGGLYLCGSGIPIHCDRVPYELVTCPTCDSGIKFSRSFQRINWAKYAGSHTSTKPDCSCSKINICPICFPHRYPQPYALMWIGDKFYSPIDFVREANHMGISRRIAAVPKCIKLGETWVLLAHLSACGERREEETGQVVEIPGVFYVFKPTRIEKLIWKSEATPELLNRLKQQSITPIIIPDGDIDHDEDTPLVPDESIRERARNTSFFNDLRSRIGGKK